MALQGPKKNFKFVFLGPRQSGKSSFAERLLDMDLHNASIGCAFHRYVHNDGSIIELWDSHGTERYGSIPPMYLRGCHVILVFVNPSKDGWESEFRDYLEDNFRVGLGLHREKAGPNYREPYIVFVSTRSDLPYNNFERLELYAEDCIQQCKLIQTTIPILPISLKNKDGFDDIFETSLAGLSLQNRDLTLDNHVDVDNEEKISKDNYSFCTIL